VERVRESREINVNVKKSLYRPGQALRVPGDWGSHISRNSAHEIGKVVSTRHRPPLPPPPPPPPPSFFFYFFSFFGGARTEGRGGGGGERKKNK